MPEHPAASFPDGFVVCRPYQTADVEPELNGLMTYDRNVVKLDEERLREANIFVCSALENE